MKMDQKFVTVFPFQQNQTANRSIRSSNSRHHLQVKMNGIVCACWERASVCFWWFTHLIQFNLHKNVFCIQFKRILYTTACDFHHIFVSFCFQNICKFSTVSRSFLLHNFELKFHFFHSFISHEKKKRKNKLKSWILISKHEMIINKCIQWANESTFYTLENINKENGNNKYKFYCNFSRRFIVFAFNFIVLESELLKINYFSFKQWIFVNFFFSSWNSIGNISLLPSFSTS